MDSQPALYSPTGYGIHDGEAVVRTPHTVKTLQGPDTETLVAVIEQADGETPASALIEQVPNADADYIDLLYEHRLAYDGRAIPAGLQRGGLLEPVLPSVSPEHHHEVPSRLASCSVAVVGDRATVSPVVSRLRDAGVSVSDDGEPDMIVLSELLERNADWAEANERWATAEATLIKTRLTETGWRLGPVLTADARACLNCLYSRVDANKAGGRLFTDTVTGEPPYDDAYVDTVTELLFRALLGALPRYLDEQVVVYDHYDGTVTTPRVFALPGCEVCDDA